MLDGQKVAMFQTGWEATKPFGEALRQMLENPYTILAAILVVHNRPLGIPLLARNTLIDYQLGLAPEVLPVVSVDTRCSLVGFIPLRVRAPYCLVVKHVEVSIFLKFFDQVNRDLRLRVREGAVLPVFANTILFSET
jgi:hypothetical protein